MEPKELTLRLFGRVQGVGFRQFVKKQACDLKITGFVRNESDGSVLIVAQGDRSTLERFLESVNKGPFLSRVDSVSYAWNVHGRKFNDFVIAVGSGFIKDQRASFTNLGKDLLNIQQAVPLHVAIIPDGNRRWARERGKLPWYGHKVAGSYDNLSALLREAQVLGIKHLTLWGFSTENWNRDSREVKEVFTLVLKVLKKFRKHLLEQRIQFRHFGRRDRLPRELVKEIESLEKATCLFNEHHLNVCLDYGGRDELTRAINKMLKEGISSIDEKKLAKYLDTEGIPDPDLVIRTSGEHRTSGFMPFQTTYAELYFTDVKFPDFGPEQLRQAVAEFSRRKRNFGK